MKKISYEDFKKEYFLIMDRKNKIESELRILYYSSDYNNYYNHKEITKLHNELRTLYSKISTIYISLLKNKIKWYHRIKAYYHYTVMRVEINNILYV